MVASRKTKHGPITLRILASSYDGLIEKNTRFRALVFAIPVPQVHAGGTLRGVRFNGLIFNKIICLTGYINNYSRRG
jgi:hypothetical protein